MQLLWSHPSSCKQPQTHRFTKLDLGRINFFICHWCPVWEEEAFLHVTLGKVTRSNTLHVEQRLNTLWQALSRCIENVHASHRRCWAHPHSNTALSLSCLWPVDVASLTPGFPGSTTGVRTQIPTAWTIFCVFQSSFTPVYPLQHVITCHRMLLILLSLG